LRLAHDERPLDSTISATPQRELYGGTFFRTWNK
jgi:hypothetical protein